MQKDMNLHKYSQSNNNYRYSDGLTCSLFVDYSLSCNILTNNFHTKCIHVFIQKNPKNRNNR